MAVHAGIEVARAPDERAAEIHRWERDLAALADDRRLSVIGWLRSSSVDAQSISGARRTEEFVLGGDAARGEARPALVEDLLGRFVRPRGDSVAGLWIVGDDGRVLASAPHTAPPDPACLEAAASADAAGRTGNIHLHGSDPVVPVAAAIAAPPGTATSRRPAALFAFAARPLFALLARRATQPATLESYLVRTHDGRLEFLSPLLFGTPVAGAFDDPRLSVRAGAGGHDTFGEGLDYRDSVDHPVLTVTRAIAGTDWWLAVEVDVSEALAPLGERQRNRRLLAIGVWIGLFGMAFGAARAQRAALGMEASRVAARYITLVNQANDALVVMDVDGRIVEANRGASELYGRTHDEILRMSARDFRPSEERGETDERLAHVLKVGGGLFDATHVRADGTTFPAEVNARLVVGPDGEQRIVVVTRDVTARRADAGRIHRLNRMLRTISSVNELLIRAPEEQHLFEEVCRISVESTGFLAAWIGLADRATGRVKVAAAAGAHGFLDDLDVRWDDGPLAEGPTGTAIREGRTVALRELDDDGRTTLWRDIGRQQGFGSCAATPIRRGGEVTGTLTLYSAEPSAFDTEIVGLVEEMAADIGFALTTIDNRRRERALLAAKEAAEQESRASEVRFRTLIENAPMGIGVSREGMTLYVNPACAKMLGYGSEELVGRPVIDFWSSEIGEQIDRRSRAQSEGLDISSHYEADAVRRDGSRLRAEVSVIPMDLPDGPAVVGFMSDITERIRADAALRESELRFRMFIEKAPLAISLARGATGLYANEKFLELWRYKSNDEVVGRSLLEHWAPHDRPIIAERMRQRALGLPVPPYQRLAQRADGTTFPARLEAVSVELPDGPVTAAFITDETDRSLAEEARRESELRLRQIAEGIDQVVWLADAADSRFLYVSPAFATVYGRAVEELYADPGLRLAAVHPDDAKRVRAAIETTQARGDYDESYRIVRPDGTVRSIRDRAFPIRNADAEVYRIVGVSRDVTHERALLVAKEAAEQASRAKSSFLAHISHEIRTPMNAILGYAQLLLRDDALADAQRRKVEVIQSSGGHLLQVLNDVLEMAKIEAGRASLSPVPFDLRAMLGDVESMFGVLTAMKGVALTVECDPALPQRLEADAGKVKQVVINLLSNAVKFTERGKIGLRASFTESAAGTHTVRIRVEDTGIGIDAEGVHRLFQAFEQLSAGARIGGTGLGLAISRNFAQLMGGDVTVESTPGAGSAFTFTFQAKLAGAALAENDPRPAPVRIAAAQARPKILVVDDVATNRALCDELLSRLGFETKGAASGEEALAVHASWDPDLVLMDLRMPGMGGLEAMRRLRASGSKTKVVALTASGLADAEPEALAAGADVFVRKPYEEGDLLRRIGELLSLRYEYATKVATLSTGTRALRPLHGLLKELPDDLVRELRDAAIGARAQRLEELAKRVREHSEAAAAEILELARSFRYDRIVSAIDAREAS